MLRSFFFQFALLSNCLFVRLSVTLAVRLYVTVRHLSECPYKRRSVQPMSNVHRNCNSFDPVFLEFYFTPILLVLRRTL